MDKEKLLQRLKSTKSVLWNYQQLLGDDNNEEEEQFIINGLLKKIDRIKAKLDEIESKPYVMRGKCSGIREIGSFDEKLQIQEYVVEINRGENVKVEPSMGVSFIDLNAYGVVLRVFQGTCWAKIWTDKKKNLSKKTVEFRRKKYSVKDVKINNEEFDDSKPCHPDR